MKVIKVYKAMDIAGQENFIAHESVDLVQKMNYYRRYIKKSARIKDFRLTSNDEKRKDHA